MQPECRTRAFYWSRFVFNARSLRALTLLFSFSFSLLLSYPNEALASFGISPSRQVVDDILAGTIVSRQLTISRASPLQDDRVIVSIEGPHKDAIIGAKELILPSGMDQVPYYFSIATAGLPVDTDLSSTLRFVLMPKEAVESGAGFALTLSTEISFRITNERINSFEIKQVIFDADEQDGRLRLSYFIINTGNTQTKPSLIRVRFTDQKTLRESGVIEIRGDDLPDVSAFSEDNIFIDVDHTLKNGLYFVEAEMLKGSEVVYKTSQSSLKVIGAASTVTRLIREPSFQYTVTVLVMGVGGLVWLRKDYRTLR